MSTLDVPTLEEDLEKHYCERIRSKPVKQKGRRFIDSVLQKV